MMSFSIVLGSAFALAVPLAIRSAGALSRLARCPACSSKALRRVAVVPFGFRFYRCARCGARCKQMSFIGAWVDASGPEDEARYREREAGAWKGGAPGEVSDTTCGKLLGRKRSWKLSGLVHRTGWKARVVRPTSPKAEQHLKGPETTVGRLLRKKLFRDALRDEEPLQDRWLDP
jgi:DNA-directed RNA polymerase subunit RPC12/RpoP